MRIKCICRAEVLFQFHVHECMLLKRHLIGLFLHFLQKPVQFLLLLPYPVLLCLLSVLEFDILLLFVCELLLLLPQRLFLFCNPVCKLCFLLFQPYRITFTQRVTFFFHGNLPGIQIHPILFQLLHPGFTLTNLPFSVVLFLF